MKWAALVLLLTGCVSIEAPQLAEPDAAQTRQLDLVVLTMQSRYPEMLDAAREMLRDDPGSVFGHRLLQDALAGQGRMDDLERQYAAPPLPPAPAAYLRARVAIIQGDLELARTRIREAVAADPAFCWSYPAQAYLAQTRGDRFGAILVLEEGLEHCPEDIDVLTSMGRIYLSLNFYRDAEQVFRRSFELAPWDPRQLGLLGTVWERQHRDSQAQAALELALERLSMLAELHEGLARIHYRNGRMEEGDAAVDALRAAGAGMSQELLLQRYGRPE